MKINNGKLKTMTIRVSCKSEFCITRERKLRNKLMECILCEDFVIKTRGMKG